MPTNAKQPVGRIQRLLDRSVAAWLTLALGLLLTLALWLYLGAHLDERNQERFIHRAETAQGVLLSRLSAYELMLRGTSGLFAASDHVSRAEWKSYTQTLQLGAALPGVLGIGFSELVPAAQLQFHLARVRGEGFPDYTIHPPDERDTYTSIVYLEPFSGRNLRAFGYDMFSEPVRREAMERARDTGLPAMSGKVILVQEDGADVQNGFLVYLPIYWNNRPTTDLISRRAALHGFVYSPFRADDVMRNIFGGHLREVDIALYDGEVSADTLLFSSSLRPGPAWYTTLRPIEFGGRLWVARFSSTARFEGEHGSKEPALVLFSGIALSLMLFAVLHTNARHRRRMHAAAIKLAKSRDEFRTLVENVPGVVFRCELHAPWKVIHISPGVMALTGASPEQFMAGEHTLGEFMNSEDVHRVEEEISTAEQQRQPYEVEYRMRDRGGRTRWVSERGRIYHDDHGRPLWLDGVIVDITERKASEEAIRSLAFFDPLTRLPNRRFLHDRLRQALSSSTRTQRHGALLFLDLDHFKDINDTLGHEAGDALLLDISNRLKDNVRESDTVARLGGDEFVLMLEDLGANTDEAVLKAGQIADKVLKALNEPYTLNGEVLYNTPSIGLTTFCGAARSVDELMRQADRAMYRAKSAGRNRVEITRGDDYSKRKPTPDELSPSGNGPGH